jgi:chromate transporter
VKENTQPTLRYLFFTFLKIGSTSWGGFMALISVVQKQLVDKDKKIDGETLLEGISLASVLPGPTAFNVVTFVGFKLKGLRGALVSMVGIVLPSFLLMLLLSALYIRYGDIPSFNHFFDGILPAVAAIILSVSFGMAKKNISDVQQILITVAAAIIVILLKSYIATLVVMIFSGIAGYLFYFKTTEVAPTKTEIMEDKTDTKKFGFVIPILLAVGFVLVFVLPYILPPEYQTLAFLHQKIMLAFSGMSLSLFGGGYVVIPAMQQVVVTSMNWLSHQEFTDAIAMGQITPGPIFISATFIGYKVAGFWGALNATVSIFLPPGLVMIACASFFNQIRNSAVVSAVFKGLRPAIIGMIAAAAYTIMMSHEISLKTGLLFCAFLILAIRYKADPVFLIPGAGLIGLLIF